MRDNSDKMCWGFSWGFSELHSSLTLFFRTIPALVTTHCIISLILSIRTPIFSYLPDAFMSFFLPARHGSSFSPK